jgi:hypothetical protein
MKYQVAIELPETLSPETWPEVDAALEGIGFQAERKSDTRTLYRGSFEGNPDSLRMKIDEAFDAKSLKLPLAISAGD